MNDARREEPTNLGAILDAAEARRKTVTYYAPEADDFVERLDTRNLDVEFRQIPPEGPEPFVLVRADGRVRGAIAVETLREYVRAPRSGRRDVGTDLGEYATLVELLDDTVFTSLNRQQLLSTAREFEDRAWRVGNGAFHVGFQSASAFADQRELYRDLAAETALDIHVYVADEGVEPVPESNLTVHVESAEDVGRYWFMVFDGGDEPEQGFALVAEQRTDDSFYGVWTYDRELVEKALSLLPAADEGEDDDAERSAEDGEGLGGDG